MAWLNEKKRSYPPKQLLDQIAMAKSRRAGRRGAAFNFRGWLGKWQETVTETFAEIEQAPDTDNETTDSIGIEAIAPKAAEPSDLSTNTRRY